MQIAIWSDVDCPWCYIGEHRVQAAPAEFERRDDVHVTSRRFELESPRPGVSGPATHCPAGREVRDAGDLVEWKPPRDSGGRPAFVRWDHAPTEHLGARLWTNAQACKCLAVGRAVRRRRPLCRQSDRKPDDVEPSKASARGEPAPSRTAC
jgi:hypothetical protein